MARKFATADSETQKFVHGRVPKPFIWGFYDGENFRYFLSTSEFIDFIRTFSGIIYMHNGGKFDFHFLLDYLEPQAKVMIINGRIARMKIGECELRDSYLLLPVPLSAYKKDEIDYDLFEENIWRDHLHKIVSYLKGDCVYLYEILEKQFEDYGQTLTLASSAFEFWFKKKSQIKTKPRTSQFYFKQFKPFYYGGRVQCFEKGFIKKKFKVFDLNSAYPDAMTKEHAYGNQYELLNSLPEKGLEQCFIKFTGSSDGILPFRCKEGLLFPEDGARREYHATGWELKLGLERGLIKIHKIDRIYRFTDTINFADYVDHFYALKASLKNGDAAKYLLAKLYLNSLYGKFAINAEKHRDYELIEPQFVQGYLNEGFEFEGNFGHLAVMSKEIPESRQFYYNVATAASVTGFVRAKLYDTILKSQGVLYCDTDSIACESFGGELGKGLGQWNHEGDFDSAAIGGKKLYSFRGIDGEYKISSKGARLTPKDIFSIAKGETVNYKSISPTFSVGKPASFIDRDIKMT